MSTDFVTDQSVLGDAVANVLATMTRRFRGGIVALLRERRAQQDWFDAGALPAFLPETEAIRLDERWRVAPAPPDLRDRRVEIVGAVDRASVFTALTCGANAFVADFEDATSPRWINIVDGQRNLRDAVHEALHAPAPGRPELRRDHRPSTALIVRPRGWQQVERHWEVDGVPVPAALFDVVVYAVNNARELLARGSGPYFCLPKLQSHKEARLWAQIFAALEDKLRLRRGSIRATVLIETLPAAFEMDEILYALREHIVGLRCSRWGYLLSAIKVWRRDADLVCPDREHVTMESPFLRAYTRLLVATCHRRGAHAIGDVAPHVPRRDPVAHAMALDDVRADKSREVHVGHDGTGVVHPDLVAVAREAFDDGMPWPHQLHRVELRPPVGKADLLDVPSGLPTERGLRRNVHVSLHYLTAWLAGRGSVVLYGLTKNAAAADVSRAQLWQWLQRRARLADGRTVTPRLIDTCIEDERSRLDERVSPYLADAEEMLRAMCFADELCEFMTVPAYERLERDAVGPESRG